MNVNSNKPANKEREESVPPRAERGEKPKPMNGLSNPGNTIQEDAKHKKPD